MFLLAHEKLVSMGADVITVDPRPSQDSNADPGLNLSDIDMFFDTNAATALSQLSKLWGMSLGRISSHTGCRTTIRS